MRAKAALDALTVLGFLVQFQRCGMQAGVVAEVALVQLFLGVQGVDVLVEVVLVGCGIGTRIA